MFENTNTGSLNNSSLERNSYIKFKNLMQSKGVSLKDKLEAEGYNSTTNIFNIRESSKRKFLLLNFLNEVVTVATEYLNDDFLLKSEFIKSITDLLREEKGAPYVEITHYNLFDKNAINLKKNKVLNSEKLVYENTNLQKMLSDRDILINRLGYFHRSEDNKLSDKYSSNNLLLYKKHNFELISDFVKSNMVPRMSSVSFKNDTSYAYSINEPIPSKQLSALSYLLENFNLPKGEGYPFSSKESIFENINDHLGSEITDHLFSTGIYVSVSCIDGKFYPNRLDKFADEVKQDNGNFLRLTGYKY